MFFHMLQWLTTFAPNLINKSRNRSANFRKLKWCGHVNRQTGTLAKGILQGSVKGVEKHREAPQDHRVDRVEYGTGWIGKSCQM